MLENLNYIYMSMYALDVYKGLLGIMIAFTIVSWVVFIIHGAVVFIQNVDSATLVEGYTASRRTMIIEFIVAVFFTAILVFTPSRNTVKAYMGVKAVQAVGNYIDTETDIPERSKATITKLWDKVDSYIETIDIENKVDSTVSKVTK
jgi:hypothetical protein